jgi:hypothetical protein
MMEVTPHSTQHSMDQSPDHSVHLNLFGVGLSVVTNLSEIAAYLKDDFSFFLDTTINAGQSADFRIEVRRETVPVPVWVDFEATLQSPRCLVFQRGQKKFIDYHGRGQITENLDQGLYVITSMDSDFLKEMSHLTIMSVSGKRMDLAGFHKIHAGAVAINKSCLLFVMPSHGGKSTLVLDLLTQNQGCTLVSDDSPVITPSGKIQPFLTQLGLKKMDPNWKVPEEFVTTVHRKEHGTKQKISLSFFKNRIEKVAAFDRQIIFLGRRRLDGQIGIKPARHWVVAKSLIRFLVIGEGLPIIFELFWRSGWRDFFVKASIALRRSRAMVYLILRSHFYELSLGTNRQRNADEILRFARDF